ncbi:LamG-like jellyroll fold domain-containing protein [Saccharothrix isguenensis]
MALSVVLAGVVVAPSPPALAASVVPDSAPDEATALRYAREGGKQVVVDSATTETDELRADPDGTMTLIQYVQPVRIRRGDAWVAVDLTLERKPDGTLGPKAGPVEMAFSGGGPNDAPIAKVARDGNEVGLKWSGDLPEPVLDGPRATYPDVLPGVDLEVEAGLKGFSEVLVVKTPEAARTPEVRMIAFGTHVADVQVEDGPKIDDGLIVRNSAGMPVFSGQASRMWDSSGDSDDNRTNGPSLGDRRATMAVEVTPGTVAISPDQSFLDDPSTTYPVLLDPDYSCTNCGKNHHAVVQDQWPDARTYDVTSGDLGDLKAGYLGAEYLGTANNGRARSFLEMNTSAVAGKFIHGATLRTKVVHTFSCSPSATEVWWVGAINVDTTWHSQPGWIRLLSENARANNARYCPTDGGADFDVLSAVREAAGVRAAGVTFMLKAKNENDLNTSWRRFDLNPYLEVKYNSYPNPPTDLGMEGWGPNAGDALPCVTGVGRTHVATKTPRLRARVSDADGGMLADVGFAVDRGPVGNSTFVTEPVANWVPSGSFAEVGVPAGALVENGIYNWSAYAGDGGLRGGRSRHCEFLVDTVAPSTPAVSSTDYPTAGVNGSVGRTGIFTFRANGNTGSGGAMDVVRYGWSLNDNTAIESFVDVTSNDGTVSVPITPRTAGTNVLHVTAFDKAKNRAATNAVYAFDVAAPVPALAAWTFNASTGTTVPDGRGNHPMTLSGGASLATGYAGNALTLNGSTAYAASAAAVLDTSRAFSVSTWVKLDSKADFVTVVCQDGAWVSPFYLQYAKNVDRWSMTTTSSDSSAPAAYAQALSTSAPKLGVWTHLVGTYDPDLRRISLYVDGVLQSTATATTWKSSGKLVVGANNASAPGNFFPGAIDYTEVWDRVLRPGDAVDSSNLLVPRSQLRLDERTGTQALDEVTTLNASLSGGTSWAGTPVDPDDPNQALTSEDKWLKFDGTGEVVAQRHPLFRTDRSFTVSAWVRHDGLDAGNRVAVSMGEDANQSPFMLGYFTEQRRWGWRMSTGPTGADAWVVFSDELAQANTWVHLVGRYDYARGRLDLFVNGVQQARAVVNPPAGAKVVGWSAPGPLRIGRAAWNGVPDFRWKGDIDDVRVYVGAAVPATIKQVHDTTIHL